MMSAIASVVDAIDRRFQKRYLVDAQDTVIRMDLTVLGIAK